MPDRQECAIAHARRVLAANAEIDAVEKTIWGSPAGKKRIAQRLVALLPAHKTYVEPFAGSAAVLFAKDPAEVEVINDADPEIADAYRLVKGLTQRDLARLRKMPWIGDEKTFKSLVAAEPTDAVERLHRFLYVTHFSYGKLRGKSFSPSGVGVEAQTMKRLEQFAPRLRRVKVFGDDYEKVVRKYDAKDTVFFLDPPYPGYNVDVGEGDFDEDRFFKLLKSLKGRFLVTYGIRGRFPRLVKQTDWWTKRIRTPRTISSMRGVGGPSVLTQLLVANYVPAVKALSPDFEFEDWDGEDGEVDKAVWSGAYVNDLPDSAFLLVDTGGRKDDEGKTVPRSLRHFPVRDADDKLDLPHLRNAISRIPQARISGLTPDDLTRLQDRARRMLDEALREATAKGDPFDKTTRLIKGIDPSDERYVLGIVLEPEVVDAQGDIYSAEEIRHAAHRFMEEFGGLGLMHRLRVNGQVKVLESYLAPTDFTVGDVAVRKGTWLLAVRVLSDELWDRVKSGELGGFSIGGSARRVPEPNPPPAQTESSVADQPAPDASPSPEAAQAEAA